MMTTGTIKGRRSWRIEELDFGAVRRDLVRDDERLFYLLACASFVEILAELYTRNLIDHCRADHDAVRWLEETWQREEVRHGTSLRAYVQTVWPEFGWEAAYAHFAAEYGATCTMAELEPSRALEMAARCVVEIGTSTLYRCLYNYAQEPVLRQLLANIKADEVRHFTEFRRLLAAYNRTEGNSGWRIWRAMWKRVLEVRSEDSYIAFKHVYLGRHPGAAFTDEAWFRFSKGVSRLAQRHYPYAMAVDMLLAPAPLPAPLKKVIQPLVIGVARLALF